MKRTLSIAIAAGALLAGVQQVGAVPITGELNLGGVAVLNDPSLLDATAITSFSQVEANAASSGVFEDAGLDSAPVTMYGFDFTNFDPVNPLWELAYGTDTFSFDLNSLTVVDKYVQDGKSYLNLEGQGELSSNHYDSTSGAFTLTISSASGTGTGPGHFTFGFQATSSTSATSVPDGGATALLLGFGVVGFATMRRRFIG